MNYISITDKSDKFAFKKDSDDVKDVTFTLSNVTENFIKGIYFTIRTYLNYEQAILDSNVSLNDIAIGDVFMDIDNIDYHVLYSFDKCKTTNEYEYNRYLQNILDDYKAGKISSTKSPKSTKRYTALMDDCYNEYNLLQFDDIEFMNGLLTFMKIGLSELYQFAIEIIYDNEKLCHQYIKHDIKVDYTPVRNILLDIRIFVNDIVGIILEYYPNICEFQALPIDECYDYRKYIHCETPCDIGQNICRIHLRKHEDLCNFPFKTSVRLE